MDDHPLSPRAVLRDVPWPVGAAMHTLRCATPPARSRRPTPRPCARGNYPNGDLNAAVDGAARLLRHWPRRGARRCSQWCPAAPETSVGTGAEGSAWGRVGHVRATGRARYPLSRRRGRRRAQRCGTFGMTRAQLGPQAVAGSLEAGRASPQCPTHTKGGGLRRTSSVPRSGSLSHPVGRPAAQARSRLRDSARQLSHGRHRGLLASCTRRRGEQRRGGAMENA
eukprot:365245-Chlamydomonas_euryale.AAC.6